MADIFCLTVYLKSRLTHFHSNFIQVQHYAVQKRHRKPGRLATL